MLLKNERKCGDFMERLNFTDRRGDEYTFIRYSANDVRITKKPKKLISGFHRVELSEEAAEELQDFLRMGVLKIS